MNDAIRFIVGLAVGLLAALLTMYLLRRRGVVTNDELSTHISLRATANAFVVLTGAVLVFWIRDLFVAARDGRDLLASPYGPLLIIALVAWVLALLFEDWRIGGWDRSQKALAILSLLGLAVLVFGLLPLRGTALIMLVASGALIVAGLFLIGRPAGPKSGQ